MPTFTYTTNGLHCVCLFGHKFSLVDISSLVKLAWNWMIVNLKTSLFSDGIKLTRSLDCNPSTQVKQANCAYLSILRQKQHHYYLSYTNTTNRFSCNWTKRRRWIIHISRCLCLFWHSHWFVINVVSSSMAKTISSCGGFSFTLHRRRRQLSLEYSNFSPEAFRSK